MKTQHLFEALNPIFFVSLISGTSPIYFQQAVDGKYHIRISNFFKIITIIYLSVYTSSLIYGIGNLDTLSNIKYFGNTMSSIGIVLDSIGQIILIYIAYIFSLLISKNVTSIIEKLAIIDSIFHNMGYKSNYNKIFWQQVIILLCGIALITFSIMFQYYIFTYHKKFHVHESLWFLYYFPTVVVFVLECQFSFMIFLIYQRLGVVNKVLKDMSKGLQDIESYADLPPILEISIKADTYSENSELKRIEILMEVHDSIVDAANEVNSNYSVQILICLAVLLIKTVFALFFAYFEQFVLGKSIVALNWSIWSAIDWAEILLITIVCHLASTQAQRTGIEIHKLLMNSFESLIRDKLLVFSQQIFHRPVEFSACGLFPIDAPLLFTIIGSGTTYLLIMLQFQEGTETSCVISNSTAV